MRILATLLSSALLCSVSAFTQDAAIAAATAACGPQNEHLKITAKNANGLLSEPEPGKALVYVIEDDGVINNTIGNIGGGITWRVGVDGAWVAGLNRHSPYTSFSLTPGVHHLCVNWQSGLEHRAKATNLALLRAESDQTYYFRLRKWDTQTAVYVDLLPVDSDQGKLLIALQPATEQKKK